jgi:uncharacterized protein YqcC (DUF446 family)
VSPTDANAPREVYVLLAELMDALEEALAEAGLWERTPPPEEALASLQPFCFDTLRFPQWLQWVFVPRVRRLVREREPLPAHSAIVPYAEEYFRGPRTPPTALLGVLERFDTLINREADRSHPRH